MDVLTGMLLLYQCSFDRPCQSLGNQEIKTVFLSVAG